MHQEWDDNVVDAKRRRGRAKGLLNKQMWINDMTADKKNMAEVKTNSFLESIEKLTLRTSTCRKAKNRGTSCMLY